MPIASLDRAIVTLYQRLRPRKLAVTPLSGPEEEQRINMAAVRQEKSAKDLLTGLPSLFTFCRFALVIKVDGVGV